MAGEEVLVVEDDDHIGGSLVRALTGSGYPTRWVKSAADALAACRAAPAELVLLDLGLPDMDGLELCRELHDLDPAATIIMLTARTEELDVVIGLDAGAVDYIIKPFKLAELLARIRAQFRRMELPADQIETVGNLRLDIGSRRVWIDDREISLRVKEFDLLARLVSDVGDAVKRDTLMADVWDAHWSGSTKTLDFHISALRRKIDLQPGPSRITTLRGVGYRYESG